MRENFDYNLIKYLVAIMETKSMAGAADKLGVTPSVVTYSVNKLRKYYEDPIFVRVKNGIQPTTLARNLYLQFKPLNDSIENGFVNTTDKVPAENSKWTIRIRSNPLIEYVLSIKALHSPEILENIFLEFHSMEHLLLDERIHRLRRKEIDVDIGFYIAGDSSITSVPLCPISLGIICRKDHPRIKDSITVEEWLQEDHIAL
ncbi:MAG TPA: LysR family transcriptional regulator [Scandinavium sp.]